LTFSLLILSSSDFIYLLQLNKPKTKTTKIYKSKRRVGVPQLESRLSNLFLLPKTIKLNFHIKKNPLKPVDSSKNYLLIQSKYKNI